MPSGRRSIPRDQGVGAVVGSHHFNDVLSVYHWAKGSSFSWFLCLAFLIRIYVHRSYDIGRGVAFLWLEGTPGS